MLRLFSFVLFLLIITSNIAYAHPGNTAADGCHYCRTNCAKWGEVEGERHCHGGGESEPAVVQPKVAPFAAPVSTPRPVVSTPKPTLRPTVKPTIKPTSKPTATPIKCSDISDSVCSKSCTAGNDIDCCGKKTGYSWYENYGCYPSNTTQCSATQDNSCSSMCSAGSDYDCCLKLEGYTWYDNWGCYPK
jgi:hypothetical protein